MSAQLQHPGEIVTNSTDDFVELPGRFWWSAKHRIELPIETRMSWSTLTPYVIVLFIFVVVFVFSSVRAYHDIVTDAWSTCTTGRGEVQHGSGCHRQHLFLPTDSFLLVGLFGFAVWKGHKRISYAMRQSGPHLRVDQETLWCEQLLEPIYFDEVFSVRNDRHALLTIALNSPPRLAYGKQKNMNTWRGMKPVFVFSRLGYPNGGELIDAIAFLAEHRRKQ
jgi:hypothetical protein